MKNKDMEFAQKNLRKLIKDRYTIPFHKRVSLFFIDFLEGILTFILVALIILFQPINLIIIAFLIIILHLI